MITQSFNGDLWVPVFLVILGVLIFSGKLGTKDKKNVENTSRLRGNKVEGSREDQTPPGHTEPEKSVKKTTAADTHHSHKTSVWEWTWKVAFLAGIAWFGTWFVWGLYHMPPKTMHPIQVAGQWGQINLNQQTYCQVTPADARVNIPNPDQWAVINLPQGGLGYEFCIDPFPDGKTIFAECSEEVSGDEWTACGRWSKRSRIKSTEKPVKSWFEPHTTK